MIRLLALDIDGTILDSNGQVPEANRRAIQQAIDAGVEVVLATGRRYEFALPIVDMLPGPLTLILSNGAIVKTREGDTLMRHLLPRKVARDVLGRFPQHRISAAVVFDRPREGQVVFEAIDWEHPRHQRFFASNRPFLSEVAPLEDCLTEDPIQVMFSGGCVEMREVFDGLRSFRLPPSPRLRRTAVALAEAGQPEGPYGVALTEYEHRDFSLVDVVKAGCNKGATLRAWAERRGIPRERVMAMGDNLNDLEMLEFAGTPVLMGNALAELKTRGWKVTGTNDEAGVARAIETFILSGSAPRGVCPRGGGPRPRGVLTPWHWAWEGFSFRNLSARAARVEEDLSGADPTRAASAVGGAGRAGPLPCRRRRIRRRRRR